MHIRPATIDEARRCAGVVAAALLHDPVGVRAVRSTHDRLRRMTSLYEAELRLGAFLHGLVDVAVVDDEIVGVAAWVEPNPSRDMLAIMRQVPRYVHAIGPAHALSAVLVRRARRRARPDRPHWLLADVAVVDRARGLGIGGALIEHGLARIDGPAYLEATTAGSQRLYERHGFTLRSRIGIAPGGFPVGMWREPHPAHVLR